MLPSLTNASTKVVPSPSFKKKPLRPIEPSSKTKTSLIHEQNIHSSSYHNILDDLEDRIGRSATHDEVVNELTRKLKDVTTNHQRNNNSNNNNALDLLETNLQRSQTEIGDDIKQWKPDDYMHHEQLLKSQEQRHRSLGNGKRASSKRHRHPSSNLKRAGTLARVVISADPGLGDDFQTNGKPWIQPSVEKAMLERNYT